MKVFLTLVTMMSIFTACGKSANTPQAQSASKEWESDDDTRTPSLDFLATMHTTADQSIFTKNCAKQIERLPDVKVIAVFETRGEVDFKARLKASKAVETLNCVRSVEMEVRAEPKPSTRVGN